MRKRTGARAVAPARASLRAMGIHRSLLLCAGLLAACDDATGSTADGAPADAAPADAAPPADACVPVAAPTACPDPPVTYADVQPIVEARCLGCHWGQEGGPWPLTSYTHVADWQDFIRASLLDCTMPPRDSGVGMTATEKTTMLEWVRCGAPE